jgi:hypothetical protein
LALIGERLFFTTPGRPDFRLVFASKGAERDHRRQRDDRIDYADHFDARCVLAVQRPLIISCALTLLRLLCCTANMRLSSHNTGIAAQQRLHVTCHAGDNTSVDVCRGLTYNLDGSVATLYQSAAKAPARNHSTS